MKQVSFGHSQTKLKRTWFFNFLSVQRLNQGSWDGLGPPSSGVRLRPLFRNFSRPTSEFVLESPSRDPCIEALVILGSTSPLGHDFLSSFCLLCGTRPSLLARTSKVSKYRDVVLVFFFCISTSLIRV